MPPTAQRRCRRGGAGGAAACAREYPAIIDGVGRRRSAALVVAADGDLAVLRDRDRPTGRLLRQGDMDASYVDLADPRHLEFDYLRWLAALVEALGARRVVHVGGAACALARALAAAAPAHHQEVVEVDQAVLDVARE